MRLQKYIAMCGVTSRRKAEDLILQNRVKVNDKIVDKLGYKVDEKKDIIKINDKVIELENNKVYILLNKPLGYVTTVKDEFNRNTVMDLLGNVEERVYPVGRLDKDTSGLLILTNDGDLTYKLTHPSSEIKKTYMAKVKGIPNHEDLEKFRNGLKIEDYITAPCQVNIKNKNNKFSTLEISIHEGRNRQVRKMCSEIGYPVLELQRISIANLNLGGLSMGDWRYLTEEEISYLTNIGV